MHSLTDLGKLHAFGGAVKSDAVICTSFDHTELDQQRLFVDLELLKVHPSKYDGQFLLQDRKL